MWFPQWTRGSDSKTVSSVVNLVFLVSASLLEAQEFTQTRQRASMLQKLMSSKFFRCCSRLDVYAQTDTQECLQFFAQLLGLFQSRRAVCRNEIQRFQRLFVQVRRLRLNHLNRHDAKRPDIDFGAILLLLDDLGSHPIWRADHGSTLRSLFRELGAEAKIRNLDGAA